MCVKSLQVWFSICCVALLCVSCVPSEAGIQTTTLTIPGETSDFYGFVQHDFQVEGIACKLAVPHVVAEGRPWIWRARFWIQKFREADIALLHKGYHVAYADVAGLFGSPEAVARWDRFYVYATEELALNPKVVLEGLSRGGLIVYNWAVQNPDKVRCIYADAPVCDFKSWPGGKGRSEGSPTQWQNCLQAYHFTEAEALAYKGNPIDTLKPLADARIPLLHVVGDVDKVVPVEENTVIIEERYKALGGYMKVIHKKDVGHHPHGLEDPQPIVDFIVKGI